jgi:hypothetical protein
LVSASLTVSLLGIVMTNIASLHRSAQASLLKSPSATTHQYTHANLRMKERALAKLQESDAKVAPMPSTRLADRVPEKPVIMKSC